MLITFTGTLNGSIFNKIKIIIDDPEEIVNNINDIVVPYKMVNNMVECYVIPQKHKEYYLQFANDHINKKVNVTIFTKRYSFDGKKGTSFILKQLDIINI